jgi:hypothetical protein
VKFYGDWVKVEISPNTLADYPHKTSSTKQGLNGGDAAFCDLFSEKPKKGFTNEQK